MRQVIGRNRTGLSLAIMPNANQWKVKGNTVTIPINMTSPCFGTVAFWRSVSPHYKCRTWKGAMNKFAMQHGKAIAMLANDSARIVECNPTIKSGVKIHTLNKDEISWFRR